MPSQIDKLEAHASPLLSAFLGLRERYALLEPMLFSEEVTGTWGSGKRARGFQALRHSLFLSCAQDISKLTLDSDKRSPSISNLMASIRDDALCDALRENYSIWVLPDKDAERDPTVLAVLKQMEREEQAERRKEFDELLVGAREKWSALEGQEYLLGFQTIRDKVAAHAEVRFVDGTYQFLDLSDLGMKWSDLKLAIDEMQSLIEHLGLVIRSASFAWEMFDTQMENASRGLWHAPSAEA